MEREETMFAKRRELAERLPILNTEIGQYVFQIAFEEGCNCADSHPRKGLVDIEKMCEYLYKNCVDLILTDTDIEHFRKAMLEEE